MRKTYLDALAEVIFLVLSNLPFLSTGKENPAKS